MAVRSVQADHLVNALDMDKIAPRPLHSYKRIAIAGLGKASMAMAGVLENKLGDKLQEGLFVVPDGYQDTYPDYLPLPVQSVVLEAAHPVPDQSSSDAAQQLLQCVSVYGEGDLVIAPISGGGTALTTAFVPAIPLEDGQEAVRLLLRAGADIQAMNTVRKHISIFGGGRFAKAIMPADASFLVISDVIGDDLSVIASGPGVPDATTFHDAYAVLEGFGLLHAMPVSVRQYIDRGMKGIEPETVKDKDLDGENMKTHLIGTNADAVRRASEAAKEQGLEVVPGNSWLDGEASEAGKKVVAEARKKLTGPGQCMIWGGETTVTVRGQGRGGRNQELVLGALLALQSDDPYVILSGGTDGIDGPTDAAGAVANWQTRMRAQSQGLDPLPFLENNDAYTFFQEVNGLIKTGSTHTNVMDLTMVCYPATSS